MEARLEAIPSQVSTPVVAAPRQKGALDWRVAGVLLGALVTLAVALQGPLGVSTAYVTADALLLEKAAPQAVEGSAYLSKVGARVTPELLVVAGVFLGALTAAWIGRRRSGASAPSLPASWKERFGNRRVLRFAFSAFAGFLLLFGARLAGGCTSGHVISGMSQLALSGMVFAAAVFASGIPTAKWVYRRKS